MIYNGKVLLTDEYRLGRPMTKFPGGGLEFGEGTADCLRREFREELGQEIEIKEHIYTTDYFQPTHLLTEPQQLISIYYRVELKDYSKVVASDTPFDFGEAIDGAQSFRWIEIEKLNGHDLSLPIDQKVAYHIRRQNTKT